MWNNPINFISIIIINRINQEHQSKQEDHAAQENYILNFEAGHNLHILNVPETIILIKNDEKKKGWLEKQHVK